MTLTARGHLGEPIRVTGQGVARMARHPIASIGFWRCASGTGWYQQRVIVNCASWTEAVLRVAAAKDGGTAGCIGIRGLAWTWRYACVQEAGNRGNGAVTLGRLGLGAAY